MSSRFHDISLLKHLHPLPLLVRRCEDLVVDLAKRLLRQEEPDKRGALARLPFDLAPLAMRLAPET